MRQGDVVYYLHGDHLGSTSLTTDQSGNKFSEVRYLPYGQERVIDDTPSPTDFGFTGQRNDSYTDLIDFGARWYDPQIGRFISADTIIPDYANPQSLNRFSYAYGNPIKYIDPSGHEPCKGTWGDCLPPATPSPSAPLPSSYVHLRIHYNDGTIAGGAGAAINTNAILSHNHHLSPGDTSADIGQIEITDHLGNSTHTINSGDFLMAGDAELGGGLSLFVFQDDLFKAEDTVALGDADILEAGDLVEQAVSQGASDGLYSTQVTDINGSARNLRGVDYRTLVVSPDLTVGGDSGGPLYRSNSAGTRQVYGINNSGEGVYGPVTEIGVIYDLMTNMTEQLR